jgi:transcriptional regulator with XRE-family HTH domain
MDNKKVGNFISTMRKSLPMTQQEIAELLGVTNKAVSKWETGEGYPEITIVPALAEILGVTVDELLRGEKSEIHNLEQACTGSSKQYDLLIDKAILKFNNAHVVSIGISLLGIILSYTIVSSTPFKGASVFGIALVISSIVILLVNYNNVKVAYEKYTQLCSDSISSITDIRHFYKKILFSVWIWMFSSCTIIALILPDKLISHFVTTYRIYILFTIGIVFAAIISSIIKKVALEKM